MTNTPDPRPGFYYVSVVRGKDYRLLRGPFATHAEALAHVEPTRQRAYDVDPRSHWYAFGTARVETSAGPGILNDDLAVRPCA